MIPILLLPFAAAAAGAITWFAPAPVDPLPAYPDSYAAAADESMPEEEQLMRAAPRPAEESDAFFGNPADVEFAFFMRKKELVFQTRTPAANRIDAVLECTSPIRMTIRTGSSPGSCFFAGRDGISHSYAWDFVRTETVRDGIRTTEMMLRAQRLYCFRGFESLIPGRASFWNVRVTFRTPGKEAVWSGVIEFAPKTKKNIADIQKDTQYYMHAGYYPANPSGPAKPGDAAYQDIYDDYALMQFFRERFRLPARLAYPGPCSLRYFCERFRKEDVIRGVADTIARFREYDRNSMLRNHYFSASGDFDAIARPEQYRQRLRLKAIRDHVFSPSFPEDKP